MCKVKYDGKTYRLPVVVLAGNGPILLGHSWLYHIPLQWTKVILPTQNNKSVKALFTRDVRKNTVLGVGSRANTALGFTSCCICH